MTPAAAQALIAEFAGAFHRRRYLAATLRALALGLPLAALARGLGLGIAGIAAALALGTLAAYLLPSRPTADSRRVARHLDRVAPELEESATLLLVEPGELAPLARLQRERVLAELEGLDRTGLLGPPVSGRSLGELVAGGLIAAAILAWTPGSASTLAPSAGEEAAADRADVFSLSALEIAIVPPAYTGLPRRLQSELDIEAVEGSRISWQIPAPADSRVVLQTGAGEAMEFRREEGSLRLALEAGSTLVYRLLASRAGGPDEQTPFARLGVVTDRPPVLSFNRPAGRLTLIEPDRAALLLEVSAQDDYGLGPGYLVATLAQGAGEMVEFRERRIPLPVPEKSIEAQLTHTLDLTEMDLGPSTELYLHVEVEDTRRPLANLGRSATTILRVPGTQTRASDLAQGLPMILPPTYFRSQRQIIIDTEKLIAERPRLPEREIRRRSEALGTDQRALRMRYGALLGEEFVSGRALEAGELEAGGDAEEHQDHAEEPTRAGGQTVFDLVPEDLAHAHDSTESATFFASETRTQLKRVLAQMWDAEGRLRGVDPAGALPFEQTALELLKDLQQRSRVYVQRVGFEAPPLEPATRRLTGELDEISTSHREMAPAQAPDVVAAARSLLSLLDPFAPPDPALTADQAVRVRRSVAQLATLETAALEALEALDLLLAAEPISQRQRDQLAATLWRLLPPPEALPAAGILAADPLTRRYRELSPGNEPQ